jgi:hypothetical protein
MECVVFPPPTASGSHARFLTSLAYRKFPPHCSWRAYLRVFRGISNTNLSGYLGFFQCLRNYRQQNAFEQAELILQAALDPAIARRARQGEFVTCLDHFDLLQTARN